MVMKPLALKANCIHGTTMPLLSLHQVQNQGFALKTNDLGAILSYKKYRIPLQWKDGILTTKIHESSKCFRAPTDYTSVHKRLGHPNAKVLERMTGISVPKDFQCPDCLHADRKNFRPKLSPLTESQRGLLHPFEIVQAD